MKRPLYDHIWTKIVERNSLAEGVLQQKIKEHEDVFSAIANAEGNDVARNVMDDGLIGHCLARCLEHLNGSSSVTEKDYYVFYSYASKAAKESEQIIDKELQHLGL